MSFVLYVDTKYLKIEYKYFRNLNDSNKKNLKNIFQHEKEIQDYEHKIKELTKECDALKIDVEILKAKNV